MVARVAADVIGLVVVVVMLPIIWLTCVICDTESVSMIASELVDCPVDAAPVIAWSQLRSSIATPPLADACLPWGY